MERRCYLMVWKCMNPNDDVAMSFRGMMQLDRSPMTKDFEQMNLEYHPPEMD